jgi:hypothetical protein
LPRSLKGVYLVRVRLDSLLGSASSQVKSNESV